MWDQTSTSVRVNLAGRLHQPQETLATLQAHGLSPAQATQSLSDIVQSQAVMVATNQVFLILAVIIAGVALSVWLSPKPKRAVSLAAAH